MTNPEAAHLPETTTNNTELLIGRLQNVLDEFGELGDDINAEHGVVRRAGFLDHNKDSRFLISGIVVITECVNVQVPGCPPAYQIDQRSHLAAPHNTNVIDKYTDEDDDEVSGILNHVLPNLSQQQFDAYKDPENAWVIKSLFDEEVYGKDRERARQISKRQLRSERRVLEQRYIQDGTTPSFARHLARTSLAERYS